jgi:predicted GH43/DUF377 family glycosyl hydrolase
VTVAMARLADSPDAAGPGTPASGSPGAEPPEGERPDQLAHRIPGHLLPDPRRVLARLFLPSPEPGRPSRTAAVVARIAALSEEVALAEAGRVLLEFSPRHRDLRGILEANTQIVASQVPEVADMSPGRALLVGACFTAEYAVEGAALCNPSVVAHPDQSDLRSGQLRVALSLRGIGEGHVSSIGFATAVIGPGPAWAFDPRPLPTVGGTVSSTPASIGAWAADYPVDVELAQQVLMPAIAEESNGLEDARFVRVTDESGLGEYRATYTAFDGRRITPRMLRSSDLRTFASHPITGPAAVNKGMALFPRRVGGRHLALCRTDGVSTSIAFSADGVWWGEPELVQAPERSWELVQIGNCGSPIETDRGWLVITHGVGPMRTYSIGAILLDLEDPSMLIARLDDPLLRTAPDERDGYVPQVVYSCGGLVHDGRLWLPHGIGDARIAVMWAGVDELLDAMTPVHRPRHQRSAGADGSRRQ